MVNASTHTVRDQELENETLKSEKIVTNAKFGIIMNRTLEMEKFQSFTQRNAKLEFLGGKRVKWFQV